MNTKLIVVFGLVTLVGGGMYFMSKPRSNTATTDALMTNNQTNTGTPSTPVILQKDEKMTPDSRYVTYSKAAFETAKGKKRVLFFHAPWCPTCRPADAEFQAKADSIPNDIVLLKTDYDSSTDLKKQYNVTYQHTFVQVDDMGREVTKWNGGGLEELIENTK